MSASEPERTRAADDKSEERFQRYLPVAPLGLIFLVVVYQLMKYHKLEQLPLALQWVLVVLVFLGVLFLTLTIVLPRWRRFWVRPCRNWWDAFVIASNTVMIALVVTLGFAIVSTFLYLQGMATTSPEHPLTDPVGDSMYYYEWNFLHSIPVLELPQALGWEAPPSATLTTSADCCSSSTRSFSSAQ